MAEWILCLFFTLSKNKIFIILYTWYSYILRVFAYSNGSIFFFFFYVYKNDRLAKETSEKKNNNRKNISRNFSWYSIAESTLIILHKYLSTITGVPVRTVFYGLVCLTFTVTYYKTCFLRLTLEVWKKTFFQVIYEHTHKHTHTVVRHRLGRSHRLMVFVCTKNIYCVIYVGIKSPATTLWTNW